MDVGVSGRGGARRRTRRRHNRKDNGAPQGAPMQEQPIPTNNAPSSAEELEKLAKLKEQGVITEDEFQAKKSQILG
ncbi:MAG: SHOCT domain-containing protein [Patescibacteria group bacterium]